MDLRVVKYNGYNLDSNRNPIAYNPYVLEENNIVQRYNFYVVEEQNDEMVLIFGGTTRLRLPVYSIGGLGWNCMVDWGDGIVENYVYPTIPDHTYSTTNNYTVKLTGLVSGFSFHFAEGGYAKYLKEIVRIDNLGIKRLGFINCSNLTKIHNGIFDNFNKEDITSCESIFQGCSSLTHIPDYLFKDFINVETFAFSFNACEKLPLVSDGVFDNCINVSTFYGIFASCYLLQSVPDSLFNDCTETLNFSSAFTNCVALTNLPSLNSCLKVTNFQSTFQNCRTATGYAEPLWLRTNPSPTFYQSCFWNCTYLSNYAQIPSSWK